MDVPDVENRQDQDSPLTNATDALAEERKQEQLRIVNQYTKGPGSEEESDDENFYNTTDQYGFLHKAELVQPPKQDEDRRRLIEVKRRTKWLKMVRNWDKFVATSKLAKRVYKGIPHGMKGDVWRLLLGVEQYMTNMPDVYQEMKTRAHSQSPDIRQIDMDVNRTYRDHVMFKTRYCIKQQQLFHVLAAYSMYNTEVGYCQGMSQIAALLLMYMSEEEAFWALHSLLYGEKHRMHGFFIPGFPKLIRFQSHHDRILKKRMSKLKKHLDENEVFASLYTMKWFFQCFLDRTPFSLTLRLWDIYMLEGEKLLIAMSFATLKMHKAFIKTQDMDGIVGFLQEQLVRDFGAPDDAVVDYLRSCMIELKNSNLESPPPPSEAEQPKLPFGTDFSPNLDKSAAANIPQFAKHSVDVSALVSDAKRIPSTKKKREKVKRGKSAATKTNVTTNGLQPLEELPNVKGMKSFKEPQPMSRSPFLRRSKRAPPKSEKKTKETKKKELVGEKSKAGDKKKTNKSQNDEKLTNTELQNPENNTEQHSPNSEGNVIQNSHSSNNGRNSSMSNGNGKHEMSELNEKHVTDGRHRQPSPYDNMNRQGDSNESHNNSNHLTVKSTKVHKQHATSEHDHSNDSHGHMKSFRPPLLSSTEKHRHTSEDESAHIISHESGHTKVIFWKTPSPDRMSHSKARDSSSQKHQESSNSFHSHGDVAAKESDSFGSRSHSDVKSSSSHNVRMRTSYVRSSSSDVLKSVPDHNLQRKTPSFTQLSAKLDSLENINHSSLSDSGGSPSSSSNRTTSPGHRISWNRPQSLYDNVTYPYNPSASHPVATVPEVPESPNTVGSFSSYEHGMEDTSDIHKGSQLVNGNTGPVQSPDNASRKKLQGQQPVPAPRSFRKKEFQRRPKWRPVSMGETIDPVNEDDCNGENSKSLENLKQWTNRDRTKKKIAPSPRKRNFVTSKSMGHIDPSQECVICKLPLDPNLPKSSSSSPFQQAVEESGIIPSSDKLMRSRRMSREEIVTAAILSQMKGKGGKKRKENRKELKNTNAFNTSSPTKSRDFYNSENLRGWEAEEGRILSSPYVEKRTKNKKLSSRVNPLPDKFQVTPSTVDESYHPTPIYAVRKRSSREVGVIARSPVLMSATKSKGWSSVEIDHLPASNLITPNEDLKNGPMSQHRPPATNGVPYYARHRLSDDGISDPMIANEDAKPLISVTRYDEDQVPLTRTSQQWIDITRYSPDHSPVPVRRSPGLSKTSQADINELLSAGINANPKIIHRYEHGGNTSAVSNSSSRTEAYLISTDEQPDNRGRRYSVSIAVQTDES